MGREFLKYLRVLWASVERSEIRQGRYLLCIMCPFSTCAKGLRVIIVTTQWRQLSHQLRHMHRAANAPQDGRLTGAARKQASRTSFRHQGHMMHHR